jgi:hypothetical protein
MDQQAAENRVEVCHRCLQPVPPMSSRCPHCGDPIKKPVNPSLILGMLGLVLLLVLFFVGFHIMHGSGASDGGTAQSEQDNSPSPQVKPALGQ